MMLKKFSLRFSNMAVPVIAWNPLMITRGLTQEVTSAPFQEKNLGAEALAPPAQPLPTATLSALDSLKPCESHHSQLGATQLLSTAGSDSALRHSWQQQGKWARAAAIKQGSPATCKHRKSQLSVPAAPTPQSHANSPHAPGPWPISSPSAALAVAKQVGEEVAAAATV